MDSPVTMKARAVIHPELPNTAAKVGEAAYSAKYSTDAGAAPEPASVAVPHEGASAVPAEYVAITFMAGLVGGLSSCVELTAAEKTDSWPKASRDLTS